MPEPTREIVSPKPAASGRGGLAAVLAILLLVPLFFYASMVFKGWEPPAPDTGAARPFGIWGTETLRATGQVPVWFPGIFSGMPSYGSLIFTPRSPLNPVADVQRVIGSNRGAWYVFLFFLGGVAAYAFFRRQKASRVAAATAALLYSMTPYFLGSVAAGHSTKIEALCLIPVLLLALDLHLERPGLLRATFLAAAGAMLAWSNHPQIVFYALLIAFLYAAGLIVADKRWTWGRGWWLPFLGLVVLAVVIAAGLAMEPYLAIHEYAPWSIRGGAVAGAAAEGGAAPGAGWNYATLWSFHPRELISFLFPSWFGLEGVTYWGPMPFTQSSHYFGVLALGLAVYGLLRIRDRRRWIWAVISGVVLVIGFGRYLPVLYGPFYAAVPYFNRFRVPSMIYSTLPLCLGVLIAGGLDALVAAFANGAHPAGQATGARREERGREDRKGGGKARKPQTGGMPPVARRALVLLAILAAGWVLFLLIGHGVNPFKAGEESRFDAGQLAGLKAERLSMLAASVNRSFLFLVAGALCMLLAALGMWPRPVRTSLAAALAILAVGDILTVDRRLYAVEPKPAPASTIPLAGAAGYLKQQPGAFRILPASNDIFQSNAYILDGLESVGGYHAAKLRIYQDLLDENLLFHPAVLRMLNVRYVLSPGPVDLGVQPVYSAGGYVYPYPDSLPRAWAVEQVRGVDGRAAMLRALGGDEFRPDREALVYTAETQPKGGPYSPAAVRVLDHASGRLHVEVDAQGPAFVVLSEISYPPGWRAAVDGKSAPIYRVDHVLQGIEVPAGRHDVVLTAHSPGRETGMRVSRASGALLLILAAAGVWLARRPRTRPDTAA